MNGVAERFQGANVVDAGRLSPYWGEHTARYLYALDSVAEKNVLDIACGTGYGIGSLRSKAKFVTGVDVSIEAARQASTECGENGGVLLGDGLSLPFADSSFDVVTSFETLEHLNERTRFLSELSRVLRAAGVLLLSTPNANYTKPVNGRPANPFHVYEYLPGELREELGREFVIERFLGQALDPAFGIPPFYDAQQYLPRDIATRGRLTGWKVMNRLPVAVREGLSQTLWKRPFYPTPTDYIFSEETVETAPVLFAVCRKK